MSTKHFKRSFVDMKNTRLNGYLFYFSIDFGEYLDYENCKCRKRLIDKLVDECNEDIDKNKVVYNATFNDYEKVYTILLITAFIIIIGISGACLYFYLQKIKHCFNKFPY